MDIWVCIFVFLYVGLLCFCHEFLIVALLYFLKLIALVSEPTFYGSRVGLLVGIIRQDGGREWTSRFGVGGDRHLFLSPLSSRLRFDKAVVAPPTNHWVSAPKTPALNSIISPPLIFFSNNGNN